jgi:hypothetical protein
MTTYTCDICSEEKTLSQMTLCGNGHFGGCQKCHMQFIKEKYKTSFRIFGGDSMVQKCMYCREKMHDYQMGENWSLKLSKLQPIMMLNYINNNFENVNNAKLSDIVSDCDDISKPKPFSYDMFEGLVEKYKHRNGLKVLCKVTGKTFSSDIEFKALFMSYLDDDDDDDVIEVEIICINGKEYYMTENKELYNPETSDLIGKYDKVNDSIICM